MPDTPIEAFIHLIQNTVVTLKNQPGRVSAEVIDYLETFSQERLIPAWQREQKSCRNPYVLSLVGLTNVGKSTLMEALLGVPVAPRKTGPATAIPVEYKYNSGWSIKVQYHASKRPPDTLQFADAQSLGRELMPIVVDIDPVQAAEIAWVTVYGPMEMLVHGLSMADTPGFGAAQVGDDNGSHQRQLEKFVTTQVDRVYFCIAAGTAWAISDIEKEFYQRISHLCGHVVITKWEGTPDEEMEYRVRYQRMFPGAEMLFVNARRAMHGTGQTSNLDRLKEIIASYSTQERRLAMCDSELVSAWSEINEYMENVHRHQNIRWRGDSLRQLVEACRSRPMLCQLSADLTKIIQRNAV